MRRWYLVEVVETIHFLHLNDIPKNLIMSFKYVSNYLLPLLLYSMDQLIVPVVHYNWFLITYFMIHFRNPIP